MTAKGTELKGYIILLLASPPLQFYFVHLKAFIKIPYLSSPSCIVISTVLNAYEVFKGQQLAGRSGKNSVS